MTRVGLPPPGGAPAGPPSPGPRTPAPGAPAHRVFLPRALQLPVVRSRPASPRLRALGAPAHPPPPGGAPPVVPAPPPGGAPVGLLALGAGSGPPAPAPSPAAASSSAAGKVDLTAEPGIELSSIEELHDWVHCPNCKSQFTSLLSYADEVLLTERVDHIPGSEPPHTTTTKATSEALLVMRHWYNIFWRMHKAGYSLRGRFNSDNFIVYHKSHTLGVRMRGRLHLIKFCNGAAHLDYAQFVVSAKQFLTVRGAVPHHLRAWLDLIDLGYRGDEYTIRFSTALMEPREAFKSTMSLFYILERLSSDNKKLFSQAMKFCSEYNGWDCRKSCTNRHMNDSRKYTLEHSFLDDPFEANIRGILKVARDCGEHPGRGMQEFMLFIMEQDFPGLVAKFHLAMNRAGLLKLLKLEVTMS